MKRKEKADVHKERKKEREWERKREREREREYESIYTRKIKAKKKHNSILSFLIGNYTIKSEIIWYHLLATSTVTEENQRKYTSGVKKGDDWSTKGNREREREIKCRFTRK